MPLELADSRIGAADQVAHDLEDAGNVVFGFAARLVALQAEFGQVGAQQRQRSFIQKAGQVVGAVEEDLGFADAAEQRVVF
ncbi:MAG: hypothetical protein Q8K63_03355, partial [Acidimicrobiales bacterium]|nr:hypothetical protein [Acidimicrobiales bacterium]